MNHKSRIYIVVGVFAVITAVMFFYVFGKLHSRNQNLSITVAAERQTLEQLQEQQRSYEQGKKNVRPYKKK
jgi:H+/gluconate symporter-like permease